MTARHIYVDETRERDYVLVASVHLGTEANTLRKAMRGFVLRGQTRIHLAKESNSRRGAIVDAICDAGVTATIYDAGRNYASQLDARAACLLAIIKPAYWRSSTTSEPTTRRYWFLSRTTHSCSGTSGFFTMQYTPPD